MTLYGNDTNMLNMLPESGYLHKSYADSFAEFAEPVQLEGSGGWLLQRTVPQNTYRDAMGCYPLFLCRNWDKLSEDLADREEQWVSAAVVPDPFGEYDMSLLHRAFPDLVTPFKEHFIVDLAQITLGSINKHHRYYARRALRDVTVSPVEKPFDYLDDWTALYSNLVERHQITGIRAFSRNAFKLQMETPGLVMLRAEHEGITVGAHLWFRHENVATSHLAAFSAKGYELNASYALYWRAVEYFADTNARWLNIGAGAGTESNVNDGLSRFKRGWATGTRKAYFCGRILNRARYTVLSGTCQVMEGDYFPLYRSGEFTKEDKDVK